MRIAALTLLGLFTLAAQTAAPKQEPPPDPTAALKTQVTNLTGQRDRCWLELGERTMQLSDIERNANAGLIGDTRAARSAAIADLLEKIEKANKGRYKVNVVTGEVTVVEK